MSRQGQPCDKCGRSACSISGQTSLRCTFLYYRGWKVKNSFPRLLAAGVSIVIQVEPVLWACARPEFKLSQGKKYELGGEEAAACEESILLVLTQKVWYGSGAPAVAPGPQITPRMVSWSWRLDQQPLPEFLASTLWQKEQFPWGSVLWWCSANHSRRPRPELAPP